MTNRSPRPCPSDRPGGQRLAHVADAFLTSAAAAADRPLVWAAAPGSVETATVLATLHPRAEPERLRDLGSGIGVRLGRLERAESSLSRDASVLLWCPRGGEGLSLVAHLALGRLAALVAPRQVTVLWFAGGRVAPGRRPDAHQRRRVRSLARRAVPAAAVTLHEVGWTAPIGDQLAALARRAG
jgi:hypothetical protein